MSWIRMLAVLACAGCLNAEAQPYPSRPLRIIVPFSPGGLSDPLARLIGDELRKALGQPVVIENKPGGGTVIGVDAVAKSAPDGHTLGWVANSFTMNPTLVPKLPYDTLKDLRPVALLVRSPQILVGHPKVPAADVRELLAYAKANPGKLSYATSGGIQHLIGESIKAAADVDIVHVPYKGGGPAINDLLGGRVDLLVGNLSLLLPHIRMGKMKPYAVTTAARAQAAPEFQTFADLGYREIDASAWFGLVTQGAVPDAIVARLNTELVRLLASGEVGKAAAAQGLEPTPGSADAFAAHIRMEIARNAQLLKRANVRLD